MQDKIDKLEFLNIRIASNKRRLEALKERMPVHYHVFNNRDQYQRDINQVEAMLYLSQQAWNCTLESMKIKQD